MHTRYPPVLFHLVAYPHTVRSGSCVLRFFFLCVRGWHSSDARAVELSHFRCYREVTGVSSALAAPHIIQCREVRNEKTCFLRKDEPRPQSPRCKMLQIDVCY